MYAVDHVKLVYHIKDKIESLTKNWSCYFQFFRSISLFWAWPMHAWLSPGIDRAVRTLHWFTFIAYDSKEYYQWDLGRDLRPRDCSVTFAFYNSHLIVLLHSVIRMSAFDSLDKMIDVWLSVIASSDRRHSILKALHHCKGMLDCKTQNKCSVFKIRKEQLTCWHVENEFWGQKHEYKTDHLKNNLQPEVFDQESKASGFIWLSWSHISFFQQLLVESISSVEIVSISGEKLKAEGK